MAPYEYEPLCSPTTQIRLLELLPGRGILQCRLKVAELKAAEGTYEPISYCWKSYTREDWWGRSYKEKKKQKTFRVLVDGSDFHITESLQAALRHMRLKSMIRVLWADAICINQADDREKSNQVTMIGRIYQKGSQTLVWLGDADFWTGRALRDLKSAWIQYTEETDSIESFAGPENELDSPPEDASARIGRHLRPLADCWYWLNYSLRTLSYVSIVQRPYFERAWIFQEVVFSKRIMFMCGRHNITSYELFDGLWQSEYEGHAVRYGLTLFNRSLGELRESRGEFCLDTILSKLSHTKTSDPRDKLYSSLGLHEDCPDGVSLLVDYSKDVDQVFLEATRFLLSQSTSLNLLSMSHCTNPSKEEHIPSWVWSPWSGSTELHLSWAAADRDNPFRASQECFSLPQFRNRMIGLHGYVFDLVKEVGKSLPVYPGYLAHSLVLEALRCYFSWVEVSGIYEQDIPEAEAKRRMRAFRCTLNPLQETHDTPGTRHSNWDNDEEERKFILFHAEIMKRFSSFFFQGILGATFRQVPALWAAVWSLYLHLIWRPSLNTAWVRFVIRTDIRAVFDRCFVRTETGDYGLCPPDTKPNDRLVLLQGANVPIVLRPSGNNWILVGECYVYGAMYGELWDQDRCEMLWIE